jgi:hypothetical protein
MPTRVPARWVPLRWDHFGRGLTAVEWVGSKPLRLWLNSLLREQLDFHDVLGDHSIWVGESGTDFSGVAQVLPYRFEGARSTSGNELTELFIKPATKEDPVEIEELDLSELLLTLMDNYPGLMVCDPDPHPRNWWVGAFSRKFRFQPLAGTDLTRRYFLAR